MTVKKINRHYFMDTAGVSEFGRSPEMAAIVERAALDGKQWAEQNAPRASGEYASQFNVDVTEMPVGFGGDMRAVAVLSNSAKHATRVERTHHTLARSVNQLEGGQ